MAQLIDVNVLVSALRTDSPNHLAAREWLASSESSPRIVIPETLAATVRILTNNRIWLNVPSTEEAAEAVDQLVQRGFIEVIGSSMTAWRTLVDWTAALPISHREVPDAMLAAQAQSLSASLVTFDRGFNKYPELQVVTLR